MFNLFSKAKSIKNSFKSPSDIVEKIHGEFDSASERLLNEAKSIIRGSNIDKGERLKNLGFTYAAPVKNSELAAKQKELANKIEYYQTYYPNNRFITEQEVERICKKYGLLFGESGYYTGDIPEKNIKEIESFLLRDEDMSTRTNMDDYMQMRGSMLMMQVRTSMSRPSYRSDFEYPSPPTEIVETKFKAPFKICAPEKDFDTRYMSVKDGFKLKYDPIVLQPVKEGYLIVSKWGIEASDEIVVNEKMN